MLRWTQRFNEVANIISSALVSVPQLDVRAELFAHFVHVAAELRKLQNFNGVFAIGAGLGVAAVHRLKATKARLNPKDTGLWEGLASLMSHDGSYLQYRTALNAARRQPPFVPYPGVHLTDLTFLGDGNKDATDDGKINLAKRQQVHGVLALCLAGRQVPYPFAALPGLARLLEAAPRLSDDEQYRLSLQIEPRGRPPT